MSARGSGDPSFTIQSNPAENNSSQQKNLLFPAFINYGLKFFDPSVKLVFAPCPCPQPFSLVSASGAPLVVQPTLFCRAAPTSCSASLLSVSAIFKSDDTNPQKVLRYRWNICYGGAFRIPGTAHCGIQLQSGCGENCLSVTAQRQLNMRMEMFFSSLQSCGL